MPCALQVLVIHLQVAIHLAGGYDHQLHHFLRFQDRSAGNRSRSPVVADEVRSLGAQSANQCQHILAERNLLVTSIRRRLSGCIPPHERRHRAETGVRQVGQQMAK